MGDTPSRGQQGANSAGEPGAPASASAADDLAKRLDGLESSLSAFIGGFDARLNGLISKRFKEPKPADGGDGASDGADGAGKGGKPNDPAVAALQRQLAALQAQLSEKDASAKAAARETALRAAIAKSGVALADTEAAYRILVADFEPDEEGGLRPRDPAHIGKPLDQFVKARIGAMPYLHAATGKAGGAGAGDAKPAAGSSYKWNDALPPEENVRLFRESKAAVGAAG